MYRLGSWIHCLTVEREKQGTSNIACSDQGKYYRKGDKLPQMGRGQDHVTIIFVLGVGTRSLNLIWVKQNTSDFVHRLNIPSIEIE